MVGKKKSVLIGMTLLVLFFLFIINYISAAKTVSTLSGGNSFSVLEDVGSVFRIIVNNTDVGSAQNITQVNITLPTGFLFLNNSNGTTAVEPALFSNTSTVLNWYNSTKYVMNGSDVNFSFWFNATPSTPGKYNFTISILNGSGVATLNITVDVNDTTPPSVSVLYPSNASNYSRSNMEFNLTLSDALNVSSCWFTLTNGSTNYTMTLNSTNTGANYTNASMVDGTYIAAFYCNDTTNNINNTAQVTFTLDSTSPVVTLISPANSASSLTINGYNFTFNVTDNSIVSNCSLIFDGAIIQILTSISNTGVTVGMYNSSLSVATHTWSINCTDSLSNVGNSSSRTLTVNSSTTAASGNGGGIAPEYTSTKILTGAEFVAGASRNLGKNERAKVSVFTEGTSGITEAHYVGVTALTSTAATIEVSSTPQTATLNVGEEKKFDVTNDNYYDILVKLNSIANSKADITLKSLHELIASETTAPTETTPSAEEEVTNTTEPAAESLQESQGISWLFWAVVVIVIIVAVIIIYYYSKKKKKFYLIFKKKR